MGSYLYTFHETPSSGLGGHVALSFAASSFYSSAACALSNTPTAGRNPHQQRPESGCTPVLAEVSSGARTAVKPGKGGVANSTQEYYTGVFSRGAPSVTSTREGFDGQEKRPKLIIKRGSRDSPAVLAWHTYTLRASI